MTQDSVEILTERNDPLSDFPGMCLRGLGDHITWEDMVRAIT